MLMAGAANASTVAFYQFNEGTAGQPASSANGAILDSSTDGYNATAVGGPLYTSNVPANPVPLTLQPNPTALSFNGTSQRITISNGDAGLTLTHSLTLEAYIYVQPLLNGNPDGNIIFRGDDSAGFDPYRLAVENINSSTASLVFAVTADDPIHGQEIANVTTTVPNNTWIHVAGTLDDATGNMDLYVNGTLQSSINTSIRPFELLFGANPGIGVGALQDGGEYFHGMIDEVRISNTALTPSQFLDAPEPSSLGLLGAALLLASGRRSRRRRKATT
jgi:hypothetical protein